MEKGTKGYDLYTQEKEIDPMMLVRLYDPVTEIAWYIAEYNPELRELYWYNDGGHFRLNYFSLESISECIEWQKYSVIWIIKRKDLQKRE